MSDQPSVRYFVKRNPARPIVAGDKTLSFVICDYIAGAYRGVYKDEHGDMPDEAIYDKETNPGGKATEISEQEYLAILEKKRPSDVTTETANSFKEPPAKAAATAEAAPAPSVDEVDPAELDKVAPAEAPKTKSVVGNKNELSEVLGISIEEIDELMKRGDCPGRMTKGYHVASWKEFVAASK